VEQQRVQEFLFWLEREKKYSPHTIRSYRTDLQKFAEFMDYTYQVDDLALAGKAQIRSWLMQLLDSGMLSSSVNRKMVTLSSFYNFLERNQVIGHNPVEQVNRPKQPKRLARFIDQSTTAKVFVPEQFERSFQGLRDRLLMEIFYATGVRVSELIGLKVIDVDNDRLEIKVLGKGNKERHIPIGASLLQLVKEYLSERKLAFGSYSGTDPLLTSDTGKGLYPMFVSRKVHTILGAYANITKTNPHVLRHTFATHLLNNGSDINAIKELLGHASLASTSVYTHNSIERLKDVYKQSHPHK
jgi:integrase/recombinase XerC